MDTIKQYRVLYADPPWQYKDKSLRFGEEDRRGVSSATQQYQLMSLDDIKQLKIPAQSNSYLFLWATNPLLREAFDVMMSWGFDYKTTITWIKPSFGLGYYFRGKTEHLLFGTKGKPGRLLRRDLPNILYGKSSRHSAKPDSAYELIEAACDAPYLELFARNRRYGWDVWGNEAPDDYQPKQEVLL